MHDDLVAFQDHLDGPVEVAVCLGDTLTHLPDTSAVAALVQEVAAALTVGGIFAATFRDYTAALAGDDRFIDVRSDDDRSLLCFLEYRPDTVMVHDIVRERTADGWDMKVSRYPKLRLAPQTVVDMVRGAGLTPRVDAGPRGMVRILAGR